MIGFEDLAVVNVVYLPDNHREAARRAHNRHEKKKEST
jgi:hypothetical protein